MSKGRIQGADIKTLADVGNDKTRLISDDKIYVTANSLNKLLSEAITAGDIGSSQANGTSGINYISNYGANIDTTGWNAYADAAGAQPVDGTGGTPTAGLWVRSTTTPLRGVANFNLVKPASNIQGQGVATDLTIDLADQGKVLSVSFDYQVVSGTYADGDVTVYLIANPSGTPVVIQPSAYKVSAATAGTKMNFVATFQTQASGQSYRICLHVASTSASAYTLAFDNFSCGPQVVQYGYGAQVTEWKSYTPTITNGAGTISGTISGKYRRIGDSLQIQIFYQYTSGTGASADFKLSIPSVGTADTTKLIGSSQVGSGYFYNAGSGFKNTDVRFDSGTSAIYFTKDGVSGFLQGTDASSTSAQLQALVMIPISGWAATQQVASDTYALRAYKNTGSHSSTGNWQTVGSWNSGPTDTHSGFDISVGEYTLPTSGKWLVSGVISFASNSTGARGVRVDLDGTLVLGGGYTAANTTGTGTAVMCSGLVIGNAGQKVRLSAYQNSTTTLNYDTTANYTHLSVVKVGN